MNFRSLISHLQKWESSLERRIDKSGWEKIKTEFIAIPVITDENGNPILDADYKYHEEGFVPDFDYMQERIEELEQYLVATGLNDYELTDEDIETLSLWFRALRRTR